LLIVFVAEGKMTAKELFEQKAPWIMKGLADEFGLTVVQAAAILGNIGHECNGFKNLQEISPIHGGAGGYGWCQWTGVRRKQFEKFSEVGGLSASSDKASYQFLIWELHNTEKAAIKALRLEDGLEPAVRAFEQKFERADPNYKHYESRYAWAKIALKLQKGAEFELAEAVFGHVPHNLETFLHVAHSGDPSKIANSEKVEAEKVVEELVLDENKVDNCATCDAKGQDIEHNILAAEKLSSASTKPPIKQFIQARYFDSGRSADISRIVVHYTTASSASSTINEFTKVKTTEKKTSSHYLIDRNGDIYQMVRDGDVAYHAQGNNADSIGIEHVASLGQKITSAQSGSSISLIKWLMKEYEISKSGVLAHKCTIVNGHYKSTDCCGDLFVDFGANNSSDCPTTKAALNGWLSANGI
jgi:hypothetical protein